MGRLLKTILLGGIIVGGLWALVNRDQLKDPDQLLGKLKQQIGNLGTSFQSASFPDQSSTSPEMVPEPVIRIATFRLERFGARQDDSQRLSLLAEICRRYDLIALQGLDAKDDRWLEMLAEALQKINPDSDYAFITDLELNPGVATQNAILFNRATLELDQQHWYVVDDEDRLFPRKPLVGAFRTRIGEPDRAFTFTVANVEMNDGTAVPSAESDVERIALLNELIRAIQKDGREEDDVILAGRFGMRSQNQSPYKVNDLFWVVTNRPTNVRLTSQSENIGFQSQPAIEFTGRGGVLDFLRFFNLRLNEAESLSKSMPVWAEFSVFEGGLPEIQGQRNARLGAD